jgi:anionic cell wall polymer biosynthesis LytR-Cps2A-Psr (LCP) family protein
LENIYKIPKLIDVLGDNLETNIPVEELVKTVDFTTLKADIQMDQLKTENSYIDGISYELVQETEIMRLNTLMEENAAKE